MKYLLLIIVLAALLFAGFYFFEGTYDVSGNGGTKPTLSSTLPSEVEEPPSAPAQRLVWSWRYRVTAEEQLPEGEPEIRTTTGPWLSVGVVEAEAVKARHQLPDGSYLQITGRPRLLADNTTSFGLFAYKWQGMKRHHWLPAYTDYFSDLQTDSVSGERSTWGYVMPATIPGPNMAGALPAAMPEADRNSMSPPTETQPETPAATDPADSTRPEVGIPADNTDRPGYDTTRPEVGAPTIKPSQPAPEPDSPPTPAPSIKASTTPSARANVEEDAVSSDDSDTVENFQSIGSWARTQDGYQGILTLSLEMRLAADPKPSP